jgi:hypothetical protein
MIYQDLIFSWISDQPVLTGVAILGLGTVYAFYGFRMFTFLLAITLATLGWLTGILVGQLSPLPITIFSGALAILGLLIVLKHEQAAVYIASGASWGACGFYVIGQFGSDLVGCLISGGIAAGLGVLFAWLCYRAMTIVITTLQGAALMVIGAVGFSAGVMPSLNTTFRSWAGHSSLVVPLLMTMICVAAYSYQSTHARGSITTGA